LSVFFFIPGLLLQLAGSRLPLGVFRIHISWTPTSRENQVVPTVKRVPPGLAFAGSRNEARYTPFPVTRRIFWHNSLLS
jgi:hypothetical protein